MKRHLFIFPALTLLLFAAFMSNVAMGAWQFRVMDCRTAPRDNLLMELVNPLHNVIQNGTTSFTWIDTSGNGVNAVQTTSSLFPTITTNSDGSWAYFTGLKKLSATITLLSNTAYTFVIKCKAYGGGTFIFDSPTRWMLGPINTYSAYSGRGQFKELVYDFFTATHTYAIVYHADGSQSLYSDGVFAATSTPTLAGTAGLTSIVIGNHNSESVGNCYIAGFRIYSGEMSVGNISTCTQWLW